MKRKGRVRITNELIAQSLNFPIGWVIEEIIIVPDRLGQSEMLISGHDFPETNNRGDAEDVELICHKENITWETKKI